MHKIPARLWGPFIWMLLCLWPNHSSVAQRISALETRWQDTFREWTIYTEGDSLEGRLELTWPLVDDWSEWKFELGDLTGQFKLKYKGDPNLWEFRAGNEIITAKTVWNNDPSQWRFSDGHSIIKLRTKYPSTPFLWFTEGEEHGYIDIFMEYEDDPSFWLVEDELSEHISPLYRIALIFVSVFHAMPKY